MYPKIQIRYIISEGSNEPVRITFYHPDLDKTDLSSLPDVVHLKIKMFSKGNELTNEPLKIKKHSLGCYVCCYSDISKYDAYNKVNTIDLYTASIDDIIKNHEKYKDIKRTTSCLLENLLKDPIVFLYVNCASNIIIDDAALEVDGSDNFDIIKVNEENQLYVGSKVCPPATSIEYCPEEYDFCKTELVINRSHILSIGEFVRKKQLSYTRTRKDGVEVEHFTVIPVKLLNRYENRIPKGVKEVTKWSYHNLWSDNEENQTMISKMKNGEVIKVRDLNKKELAKLGKKT